MSQLKVLFVAAECAPYRKTGGLGDVVGALPRYLRRRDIDARVVLPLYAGIAWHELDVLEGAVQVRRGSVLGGAGVRMAPTESSVPIYFLEHHRFFDRPGLYGSRFGSYGDNLERFAFLSHAALELCRRLAFFPDVVHAHDWHTGLLPALLRDLDAKDPLSRSASVFTIHNLAHQGRFSAESWPQLGLGERWRRSFQQNGSVSLMQGALVAATQVTTVSPTYAREIRTPEHGLGLDRVLQQRGGDFRGILNGIDSDEWDPARDPHLPASYDADDPAGKARCKAALQEEAGLAQRPEVPLFGFVGRLAFQKGVDLLADALPGLLDLGTQCVLLGTGESRLEDRLRGLADRHSDRLRAWIEFDNARAHRLQAGCDFLLMPSRFEPCGLNQLYALRYGTLPIVHSTGGLADTVENLDETKRTGTGFVFFDLDAHSLYNTLRWVVLNWRERPGTIAAMRSRAMRRDFSWRRSAAEYESLYREAVARHGG